ncbi:MAG TPA: hypothetical protein VHV56_09805 [Pseudolabrys sp.]|jgi:hypothetical protein|nr:hypothetical protein [Pseudolabrys sp.]
MPHETRLIVPAALVAAFLVSVPATAQPPQPSKSPTTSQTQQRDDPQACAHERETTGSGQNLSDRLAQSNGVICPPPSVDPQMKQPAPPGGTMPVIPPPGSPGGDQHLQPK